MILKPCIDHPYEVFSELSLHENVSLLGEIALMADHYNEEAKAFEFTFDEFLELNVPGFKSRLLWEYSNRRHVEFMRKVDPKDYRWRSHDYYQFQFTKLESEEITALTNEHALLNNLAGKLKPESIGRWLTTFPIEDLEKMAKYWKDRGNYAVSMPLDYEHIANSTPELQARFDFICKNFRVEKDYANMKNGREVFCPRAKEFKDSINEFLFGDDDKYEIKWPADGEVSLGRFGVLVFPEKWENASAEVLDRGIEIAKRIVCISNLTERQALMNMSIRPNVAKTKEQYDYIVDLQRHGIVAKERVPDITLEPNIGMKGTLKALTSKLGEKFFAECFFMDRLKEKMGWETYHIYPYSDKDVMKKDLDKLYKKHGFLILELHDMPFTKSAQKQTSEFIMQWDHVIVNGMYQNTTHYLNTTERIGGLDICVNNLATRGTLGSSEDDDSIMEF